ncbi:hypothetical protein BDF21DRAFT_467116 [Thamnidium elegans]|uniref:Monopolin complex subunit Csm1/Pcs1 C-terminal domain-containing protein n=1 Tax=Thamnidium elegans TaxID=101142 RepID=A0A8H7SSY7_9FUNG|nr:hypothetical protein INT48_005133 [Thamnidium elegans]KAI8061989.1 hypothetical protein BDF21DRAFT_467116 [Thamnidium elegans]
MSSHVFNLTGDKPRTTFSSQPVHSTEYGSQAEPSRTANTQPAPSTFGSSNVSHAGSRHSVKKRIVLNQDPSTSRHPIVEDLNYGDYDTMTSEEITSKRLKYDDRDESSTQKPKYMSDHLKEVMSSLSFRKESRDDSYNKFNSYNDSPSMYESSRPTHANSMRADKLQEKVRENEIQFDEFKMELQKQYKKKDDERQEAFLNMRKTYEDVINKVIKNDSHTTHPAGLFEGNGKSVESKFQDNVNKLMSYLTSVTVINQTESDVGILYDCEITSKSSSRSLKFMLNIPNDDTKLVDYTPIIDQLDESALAVIPDFLRESIVFAKQALPVFFWRLSSSIQGGPN